VRGADEMAPLHQTDVKGASPRARGRRGLGHLGPGGGRSIPACAGPTDEFGAEAVVTREHPRVRGADASPSSANVCLLGASPRARGRPLLTWEFISEGSSFYLVGISSLLAP